MKKIIIILLMLTSTFVNSQSKHENSEWKVTNYVDEFNEPTENKFITTKKLLTGVFSNSATENSVLKVQILIEQVPRSWSFKKKRPLRVVFKLYEYGKNLPVKSSYPTKYSVIVLDKNKKKLKLNAVLKGDRLYLSDGEFLSVHKRIQKVLLLGGSIKFLIKEDRSSSIYRFEIDDASKYDDAIELFRE